MKKFYDIAPFIMLLLTALTSVVSSSELYHSVFKYLPDTIGYSVFTNVIMLRVYKSPKFCNATRICVYGLIAMNVVNMFTLYFGVYNALYDLYIIVLVVVVIIYLIIRKNAFTSRYSN